MALRKCAKPSGDSGLRAHVAEAGGHTTPRLAGSAHIARERRTTNGGGSHVRLKFWLEKATIFLMPHASSSNEHVCERLASEIGKPCKTNSQSFWASMHAQPSTSLSRGSVRRPPCLVSAWPWRCQRPYSYQASCTAILTKDSTPITTFSGGPRSRCQVFSDNQTLLWDPFPAMPIGIFIATPTRELWPSPPAGQPTLRTATVTAGLVTSSPVSRGLPQRKLRVSIRALGALWQPEYVGAVLVTAGVCKSRYFPTQRLAYIRILQ